VFPDILIIFAGMDESAGTAVRILGMTLLFYGYYYIRAGIKGEKMRGFFKWTVHTRMSAIAVLLILVLLGLAPPAVMAFGVLELLGASWTLAELIISKKAGKEI
jgi:hypothetical protein